MNLYGGKIISNEDLTLDSLEDDLYQTIESGVINPSIVVEACHRLSQGFDLNKYMRILSSLGLSVEIASEYIEDAKAFMNREYLIEKLERELGVNYDVERKYTPSDYDMEIGERYMGLGILFHIAAGNMDGLPIYTVIEGLLAGNINILKLPSREDGGLTIEILKDLVELEPRIREYIYVFDYSSKDLEQMEFIANLSDGIVVWGGDDAIKSVRELASTSTEIIEWGNKISFAYVSGNYTEEELIGIAKNICHTNQLLCSSCQGIYLDTESDEELNAFAEEFASILEEVSEEIKNESGLGIKSKIGLTLYSESIENIFKDAMCLRRRHSSVRVHEDNLLSASIMYRNPWIKKLSSQDIIKTLKPYKNYLQTVGLVGDNFHRLSELFFRAGAVKVTDGAHMSKMYRGQAHDGEYPLRRYTRVVVREFSALT